MKSPIIKVQRTVRPISFLEIDYVCQYESGPISHVSVSVVQNSIGLTVTSVSEGQSDKDMSYVFELFVIAHIF